MISNSDSIKGVFTEIAGKLSRPVSAYIIGGAALMHYGAKDSTKDIDLVLRSREEFDTLRKSLRNIGFMSKTAPATHKNLALADWLIRGDFRMDLFNEAVCGRLKLTERMSKRSIKTAQISQLSVFICSKEDIFLFKSLTEREGDKDDCIVLIKQGLDWSIILDELEKQIREHGDDIWITLINERLEELAEQGLIIPILKQTRGLTELYYQKLGQQQNAGRK
jgi:hypothetical protein